MPNPNGPLVSTTLGVILSHKSGLCQRKKMPNLNHRFPIRVWGTETLRNLFQLVYVMRHGKITINTPRTTWSVSMKTSGGKDKMAEQIRSFWSHLCGIFGAIFGVIAGGTLVTIERADALPAGTSASQWTKIQMGGAIGYYYEGGGWLCGKVDSIVNEPCCTKDPCYKIYQVKRFYNIFMGCADGYYAKYGNGATNTTDSVTAGSVLTTLTSAGRFGLQGVTQCNGASSCLGSPSLTYSTSANKILSLPSGYYGYAGGDGLAEQCEKCPAYDDVYNNYTASGSLVGTKYPKNVSSCFMSKDTERNDAVEHDGEATGTFEWTSNCYYSE